MPDERLSEQKTSFCASGQQRFSTAGNRRPSRKNIVDQQYGLAGNQTRVADLKRARYGFLPPFCIKPGPIFLRVLRPRKLTSSTGNCIDLDTNDRSRGLVETSGLFAF